MDPNRLLGNRYRLTKRIAAGGMGEVWHAWDTRLQRDVAIKVLHPALADDLDLRRRFMMEARTVAALNEPGIVDLYDAREDLDGDRAISYLVMEFVDGQPLSRLMRQQQLEPAQVMRWLAQVCRGLEASHQAGIVHRDIKPGNIIIRRDGNATIIDFGIARRRGDVGLTISGMVMGTVEYASPEQLEGEELTGASDIYSLGAVAYECLSGQRPFLGDPGAIIAGHLQRPPDDLPDTVPPAMAAVVLRALRKRPSDRFASAADFAAAATEAERNPHADESELMTEPISPHAEQATPLPTKHEVAALRKRSRAAMVTSIVLAVLLVGAGVGLYFVWSNNTIINEYSNADEEGFTQVSPAPSKPDGPPDSTPLRNADTGMCLDIGGSGERDVVKTMDCDTHDDFDFAVSPDSEDGYRLSDEGGLCVAHYETDTVVAANCEDAKVGWEFTWIGGDEDWDTWKVERDVDEKETSTRCLAGTEEEAVTSPGCVENDASQLWQTPRQ